MGVDEDALLAALLVVTQPGRAVDLRLPLGCSGRQEKLRIWSAVQSCSLAQELILSYIDIDLEIEMLRNSPDEDLPESPRRRRDSPAPERRPPRHGARARRIVDGRIIVVLMHGQTHDPQDRDGGSARRRM